MNDEKSIEEQSPLRVVVIGGGVGGTRVANLLARRLRSRAAVELITASPMHIYAPGLLYVPFDDLRQVETARAEADLLRPEIALAAETPATSIDFQRKQVSLTSGRKVPYDYLVIATGTEPNADRIPGMVGVAYSFRTYAEAQRLRAVLQQIKRGKVVVSLPEEMHTNPTAPLEFAFLLADYLERWGLEKKTQVVLTSPAAHLFPNPEVASTLARWLEDRGIALKRDFVPAEVKGSKVRSSSGVELPFDLLVMEPPQRGVAAIRDSGLADAQGLLPSDPHSLKLTGVKDVWVVGDCSSLEMARWPSAATYQAGVVADEVVAEFEGRPPRHRDQLYNGRTEVFLDVGRGRVGLVDYTYNSGFTLHEPSPVLIAGKHAFDRVYWQLGPTGLL